MPIDLMELGAKCRRVREEILDMTLMQASELTGIEQARLASIECGAVEPSGDEVLIIADVYGERVEFFITNERSASIEKSSDLYRMYGSTFSSSDRRNIQEFLTLCRMEHEIEALLGSRPREFVKSRGRRPTALQTTPRLLAWRMRNTSEGSIRRAGDRCPKYTNKHTTRRARNALRVRCGQPRQVVGDWIRAVMYPRLDWLRRLGL